jgi:hypothetical protein
MAAVRRIVPMGRRMKGSEMLTGRLKFLTG